MLCYKIIFLIIFNNFNNFLKYYNFKIEIENVVITNKNVFIYFNVQKKIFYIKIIFSD
jgi:hypothetical protein